MEMTYMSIEKINRSAIWIAAIAAEAANRAKSIDMNLLMQVFEKHMKAKIVSSS